MKRLAAFITLVACTLPVRAQACATCFGAAGDPQTEGRNAAILTLLVITYTLFSGMIAVAFILWRRGKAAAAPELDAAIEVPRLG